MDGLICIAAWQRRDIPPGFHGQIFFINESMIPARRLSPDEIAARRAHQDIRRMPRIFRQHVARKQIEPLTARRARPRLHPQEILDVSILPTGHGASRFVEVSDFLREVIEQLSRLFRIGLQVDRVDLFMHDPCSHRINIRPNDVAPNSVGFKQRRATAHERVRDRHALEAVGAIVGLFNRLVPKLRQQQPAEQRPRPPREPLMDRDDRAVVLLDLLLAQRQRRNEPDAVILFD